MEEKTIFWCPECDFLQEGDNLRALDIVHCPNPACSPEHYVWQFVKDRNGYFTLINKETDSTLFETELEAKIVLTKFLEVIQQIG
jgi:hypothetical protein